MGHIHISGITRAPVDKVYATSRALYDCVDLFPNIREIRVIEESAGRHFSKAEWVLDLRLPVKHGELAWIHEITWDDDSKSCRLRLAPEYKGIVKRFDGFWEFHPVPEGTKTDARLEFHVEHPLVTPMVQRIFDGIMRKNNEALLAGVKRKAEEKT